MSPGQREDKWSWEEPDIWRAELNNQLWDKSAQKVNVMKRHEERNDKKRAGYAVRFGESVAESSFEEWNPEADEEDVEGEQV